MGAPLSQLSRELPMARCKAVSTTWEQHCISYPGFVVSYRQFLKTLLSGYIHHLISFYVILYHVILCYISLYCFILFYGIIISTIGILLGCPVPYLWWESMPWHWADETSHLWAFQSVVVCCGGLQIMQHQINNLLVLSREWMGMGEWDDYCYPLVI